MVHRRNSRLDSSAAVALEHVLMGAHALGARAFHALIRSDPLRLRLEKSHLEYFSPSWRHNISVKVSDSKEEFPRGRESKFFRKFGTNFLEIALARPKESP